MRLFVDFNPFPLMCSLKGETDYSTRLVERTVISMEQKDARVGKKVVNQTW
eukprot:m.1676533 g.1676533  ORF g.1676533 m.1676533 type:complete len:51 (-) comp190199_c0_seq1:284-436(-)